MIVMGMEEASVEVGGIHLVSSVQIGDMGSIVFPAARALVSWLEGQGGSLEGLGAVELGCGTGLVGLAAARLGARVLLTDIQVYLGLLDDNIRANKASLTGSAEARALDWGDEVEEGLRGSADLLLVSDCVYYEQSLEPLVRTMASLTHGKSTVVLGYERRPEKAEVYGAFFPLVEKLFESKVVSETGHSTSLNSKATCPDLATVNGGRETLIQPVGSSSTSSHLTLRALPRGRGPGLQHFWSILHH